MESAIHKGQVQTEKNICELPTSLLLLAFLSYFHCEIPESGHECREFNQNSNLWEIKQIEKTHVKEKQSHAQDNIYVVQQFAYVHGVAGISL